ncbi:DUF4135 domain-containing protein [Streptosporangium amethystogenes]|uniref:DUF4135 domain-containing protein n=1 Tax=Streptosporangium amethystogenes TaxID=2002 RepID=UPI001B800AB1|nr:DUF4135 domain-containing protein [Streptosporangium amethystogenes]
MLSAGPNETRSVLFRQELNAGVHDIRTAVRQLDLPVRPEDPDTCIRQIVDALSVKLDRAVLPVVAHELAVAKSAGKLAGADGRERYTDFWRGTDLPERLADRYPVVAAIVSALIRSSVTAVRSAIERLGQDFPALVTSFPRLAGPLRSIHLAESDRHAGGGQVIVFEFSGGRIFYKPVSPTGTGFLHTFMARLELPVRLPRILDRGSYGWVEEIQFRACASRSEAQAFWWKSGALLAVCCLLNFVDGHWENVIAAGGDPVLIDTETLLHNFSWYGPEGALTSVFDTGLVEATDAERQGLGRHAAFQVVGSEKNTVFVPFPVDDGTDLLAVTFRGTVREVPRNLPVLDGVYQTPGGYLPEILEGFRTVFARVRQIRHDLLSDDSLWDLARNCEGRQVIRTTGYYALLQRLMEQPSLACSWSLVKVELERYLRFPQQSRYNELVDEELRSLLSCDVPYFLNDPAETSIRLIDGTRRDGFFRSSALEQVMSNIEHWDETFVASQCELLKEHLGYATGRHELSQTELQLFEKAGVAL